MLYDTDMHLPQLMNWLMESFKSGKVEELEASKILTSKIVDEKTLNKIKMIDHEHDKRKKELEGQLKNLEEQRNKIVMELGKNEANYWETIIGELVRTVKNMSPLTQQTDE